MTKTETGTKYWCKGCGIEKVFRDDADAKHHDWRYDGYGVWLCEPCYYADKPEEERMLFDHGIG